MIGFVIWILLAGVFIGIGISSLSAKKATGFWANIKRPEVTDIKGYNRAMCLLWCGFGIVMIPLGLPLLGGQNSPLAVISVLGLPAEVIGLMVIYVCVIERKYRRKS